jgi:galactokinase/mevalonate kinase-like predicted kinase
MIKEELLTTYRLTIPARVNILGNPADANEGDFATLSAAVDRHAHAWIGPPDAMEATLDTSAIERTIRTLDLRAEDIPLPYNDDLSLVKGAVNRLFAYSEEFRAKVPQRGARIVTWTDVPRQSGLGGSSLFVLLALAGLRAFYDLDRRAHNDYVLAELTQRVEAKELGITCGYADRYVPLFGGLAYVDYRGKLHQDDLGQEPYATYERLDPWGEGLALVAATTGIQRDSGDVHGQMRPRYLEEHAAWERSGGSMPPMVRFMRGAWETAWRGKIALLHGDWATFGALMNENHRWVDQMMTYCGFTEGAGWANNLLIETALENGALGAKLTGAGGGGSVFALVHPGEEEKMLATWRRAAEDASLTEAQAYPLGVAPCGLRVEVIA